jgi:hypothetical protein
MQIKIALSKPLKRIALKNLGNQMLENGIKNLKIKI